MRYLCEAYQLGIAIRNDLQHVDPVAAFEDLDHLIDSIETASQRGILPHFLFARWSLRPGTCALVWTMSIRERPENSLVS
jgi:hypothetical protein